MTRDIGLPTGPMFPMRTVVLGTFVPTIFFELGAGAVIPIIVATATDVGFSLGGAAFLVTVLAIGQILMDVPAGAIAARVGDRAAMLAASVVAILGFIGAGLATNPVLLICSVLLIGGASSSYFLARQSYLTEITHPLRRARVMSTLGGIHRVGYFIGPFAGAAVIKLSSLHAVYALAVISTLIAMIFVAVFGSEKGVKAPGMRQRLAAVKDKPAVPMTEIFRKFWPVFSTLGIAVLLIGSVRAARINVLPLWTEHLGISPETTSIVFGIANAADMLLFYPAGKLMDTMGRLWVGIPAMIIMGGALIALPFTTTVISVSIVAIILGLGNGISSGILMTLGADVAPSEGRSQFLGVWRLFSDFGGVLGPAILTGGAFLGSLAAGIWVMGGMSVVSSAAQAKWVPRWSVHASRGTRRAAGLLD